MLGFERREKIIEFLRRDQKVFVAALSSLFEVTEETIRRDLEKLEKEGIVTRTYGGAVLNIHTNEDLSYQTRHTTNLPEKNEIARKLARLVSDGDTLMADPSSTAFEALRELGNTKKNLTVITNSSIIFAEYAKLGHTVISTGGTLRPHSNSLVGAVANETASKYVVDTALFSCKGLSAEYGVTDSNEPESELKKVMLKQARRTVLLADHTKFDKVAFVKLFDLSAVDYLVTDRRPSDEWMERLERSGVEVIY